MGLEVTIYGPGDTMPGCDVCEHIYCVCSIKKKHSEDCTFRIAATCAVGIACDCEHPRDVCPTCDPCTCAGRSNTITPEDL